MSPEERRAQNDQRVAHDVATHGCHVISVFDPEEKLPTFSYSVGMRRSTGAPDAIVLGVRASLGHALVNEYKDRIRAGELFERGVPYEGFLDGFSIYVEPARRALFGEYTLGCDRFYNGEPYEVVQLVYPTTSGVWPWSKRASAWFVTNQPMLGRRNPSRR